MDQELLKKKIENGRQFRSYDMSKLEFRAKENDASDSSMTVEGYACTFNEPYELYTYRDLDGTDVIIKEQVDPHAFDECDMSDVIMQYNHEGRVYARTRNKTLTLAADEHGLKVSADLSKAADGAGLYGDIKNGLVDRMSFGFTVADDSIAQTNDQQNHVTTVLRTITKVGKLYDVSAVSIPANDGTDISARSFVDGVIDGLKTERSRAEKRQKDVKRLALKIKVLEMEK